MKKLSIVSILMLSFSAAYGVSVYDAEKIEKKFHNSTTKSALTHEVKSLNIPQSQIAPAGILSAVPAKAPTVKKATAKKTTRDMSWPNQRAMGVIIGGAGLGLLVASASNPVLAWVGAGLITLGIIMIVGAP